MQGKCFRLRIIWLCFSVVAVLFSLTIADSATAAPLFVPTDITGSPNNINDVARPSANSFLHLTFALQSATADGLAAYDASLTDPSSPNYQQWLTPQQVAAKFGASQSSISAVIKYLSSQGLQHITVWPDHLFISADISRSRAESAFGVTIHGYDRKLGLNDSGLSPTFYAPDRLPSIDPSVANLVQGVFGLSDAAARRPFSHPAQSQPMASSQGYLDPIDLSDAYDTTSLHNLGLEGQGEIIAIYSPTAFQSSDISAFASAEGISSPNVTVVPVTGSGGVTGNTSLANQVEADIDIETILGQAPSAAVEVYEAPNDGGFEIFEAVESASPVPNILSDSWGIYEDEISQSYANSYETIRAALAAEGVTILVASGDYGAYDTNGPPNVSVSVDASSGYVTAVGGTELSPLNNGVWNGEVAWTYNDGTTGGATGSGGGLSKYITEPAFQTGTGVTNSYSNGYRQVPDVAALASKPYYHIYTSGSWTGYGGTSCAAPLWAGSISLIEQDLGTRLGNVNWELYPIANGSNSPFHDITSGNDGLYYCTTGWDFVTGCGSVDFGKLATAMGALPPAITAFTPTSGAPTTSVVISGTQLENANRVTFGGVPAQFGSNTATQITAIVPNAAVTGSIVVTTPKGAATSSANFTVIAPPYYIVASPQSLSVPPSSTGTVTVILPNSSGYSSGVTLSVSGLPSGVTGAFSSSKIYSNPGSGHATSSILTFTAAGSATPGLYTVYVTGTSGFNAETTPVYLTISSASVLTTVTVSPSSTTVVNSYNQQFSAVGKDQYGNVLATQPTFTWQTTGGGTISTSGLFAATAAGIYTVSAASGGVSGTASVTVSSFNVAGTAASVNQGATGTSTISLTDLNGFSGNVALTLTGLPSGVTASFSPSSISGATTSTLTFTASPTSTAGNSTITITGASGTLVETTTITLTVFPNPIFTSVAVSPAAVSVVSTYTQQFAATALDQFGNALTSQPSFTWWTTPGNSISTAGMFTASTVGTGYTVKATGGSISGTASVNVTGFSVSASGSPLSINQGSNGVSTVSLTNIDGFAGAVSLTVSGLPTGVTAAFSPTSISGTATSSLTLTVASTAAAGTYPMSITGTDGSLVQTTSLSLVVVSNPIFSTIAVSPSTATVTSTLTQQFSASAMDQFGNPLATQPSFTWSTSNGNSISSSGLFTASTPGTGYAVNATSGGVSGSAVVAVSSFSLNASANPVSVNEGSTGSTSVSLSNLDGFTDTVSLSVSGLPAGVTATFTAASISSTASSTLTFTAGISAAPGTYPVTITGTDGGLVETTSVNVTVVLAQTLSSIIVSPAPPSLVVGGTQQFTATADDQFGNALVTQPSFTWSVSGGGTINSSTGLFTASTSGGPFTVTAKNGSVSGTGGVYVKAFTLSSSTTSLSVPEGGTGTSTITLSNVNNLSGSVALSATGLPSGVTASFSPSSITGVSSSVLTVTVNALVQPQTVSVTVVGTNGTETETTTIMVTVMSNSIATSIAVSPASANVISGTTEQFSATENDQFGNALTTQPAFTWSVSGGGTINVSGQFAASSVGGPYVVTAMSGSFSGSASVTVSLTVPTPAISSLNPASCYAGSAPFTMLVYGSGFTSQSTVEWNGTALPTTYVSAGEITASVPSTSVALAGSVQVSVVNPAGSGGASAPSPFTILTSNTIPPVVKLTNPSSGAAYTASDSGYASVTMSASPSTYGGATVSNVSFSLNSVVVGSTSASPYTFTDTSVSPGTYQVTAMVTDSNGNQGTSPPISITVSAAGSSGVVTVTSLVNVAQVILERVGKTSVYDEEIVVTNNSNVTIQGPIWLVLDNVASGVSVLNATGVTTSSSAPAGSPYLSTGSSLAPGQSVTFTVEYNSSAIGSVSTRVMSTAPANVTPLTTVSQVILERVGKTSDYEESIVVTNNSAQTITGPVSLVLTGVTAGVSVLNATGTTAEGNPYLSSGSGLAPGQSVTFTPEYNASNIGNIAPIVTSGPGALTNF